MARLWQSLTQVEIIVHGTLSMLGPLLYTIVREQGLAVTRSSGQPDFTRGNWDFASYIVRQPTSDIDSYGQPVCKDLGTIRLQGLPDEETLITFLKIAKGKLPEEEAQKEFEHFCVELIQRLEQLGFREVPPTPKRKIGFMREN